MANGTANGMGINPVSVLISILVLVLGGGVAWMRGDMAEAGHRINKLEDVYHELDKRTERIQKDVDSVKERSKRIEDTQQKSLDKLDEINEKLDRRR